MRYYKNSTAQELAKEPIPKNQNKFGTIRISRSSCANSRIPLRLGRPSPPSFTAPFLTSPPDQCTPAGAVDDGVRTSVVHCTFARFQSVAEGPKGPSPSSLQYEQPRAALLSASVITRATWPHLATHNRKIITSHDISATNRASFFSLIDETFPPFSLFNPPPSFPIALLKFAHSVVYWPRARGSTGPACTHDLWIIVLILKESGLGRSINWHRANDDEFMLWLLI